MNRIVGNFSVPKNHVKTVAAHAINAHKITVTAVDANVKMKTIAGKGNEKAKT
jgi:hypothetical protein